LAAHRTDISFASGSGNLRLHAQIQGPEHAPFTVLCLHGLTRNLADFGCLAALLSARLRGIGKAIALEFAGKGARGALHGLATPDEAKALVGEMHDAGSAEARFFTGDLRDAGQVSALMEHVLAWGTLDVLVNNAGIQRTGPLADITTEMWNEVIAVNLSAPFHTMRHALPRMAQAGYGRVINIPRRHWVSSALTHSVAGQAQRNIAYVSGIAPCDGSGTCITAGAPVELHHRPSGALSCHRSPGGEEASSR